MQHSDVQSYGRLHVRVALGVLQPGAALPLATLSLRAGNWRGRYRLSLARVLVARGHAQKAGMVPAKAKSLFPLSLPEGWGMGECLSIYTGCMRTRLEVGRRFSLFCSG